MKYLIKYLESKSRTTFLESKSRTDLDLLEIGIWKVEVLGGLVIVYFSIHWE